MIPLQIPRKSDLVLYVCSDSKSEREEDEVIAGLTYNYHVSQVIRDIILHYILPFNYREIYIEFLMMETTYVADINR